MIQLALLRHGVTAWNQERRLQGRADVPLSAAGRAAMVGLRLPTAWAAAQVYCSPLQRARETAALLGCADPILEPRLIEMHWGAYEGYTIAELRSELDAPMLTNESRGLDFLPPGGESPRSVQARLRTWFAEVARLDKPVLAVTHKGVIRSALALAYDWDMKGRQPVKLDWTCLHGFNLAPDGSLHPGSCNIALEAA
jgi:broad specificity phosphatase PhoE